MTKRTIPIALVNERPPVGDIRVVRRGDEALLIDVVTHRLALCDWAEVRGLLAPESADTFPAHHRRLSDRSTVIPAALSRPQSSLRSPELLSLLIIKVTSFCPLRCTYCYDSEGEEANALDVDPERLCQVIAEALRISGDRLDILFHGGEPLTRFGLIERLVNFAEAEAKHLSKSVKFRIQTSGAVMNDRIANLLRQRRFSIGLSLDGPPATNDVLRIMPDGGGSSRLVDRQINRYRDLFVRQASILTTVTKLNVKRLDKVVVHFAEMGFRAIDFSLFTEIGRGACQSDLAFEAIDYINAMKRIIDLAERGQLDAIEVSTLTRMLDKLLLPDSIQHCRPRNGPCGAANGVMNIQANGEITGCDLLRGPDYVLGRVGESTLTQCANSPQAEYTRERYSGLTQCHKCTWSGACGGTCGASSGGHFNLDKVECEAMQDLFEHIAWRLHDEDRLLAYYLKHRPSTRIEPLVQVDDALV